VITDASHPRAGSFFSLSSPHGERGACERFPAQVGRSFSGFSGDGRPIQMARMSTHDTVLGPNGDLFVLDGDRIRRIFGENPKGSPTIAHGGIVKAFSYAGGSIEPDEMISIFWSGFAATASVRCSSSYCPPGSGGIDPGFRTIEQRTDFEQYIRRYKPVMPRNKRLLDSIPV